MSVGHFLSSSLSLWLLFVSLTFSGASFSLGLGSIDSESLLGQPLRARIPVLDVLREYRTDDLIIRKLDNRQAEQLGFEVVTSSYGISLSLEDSPEGLMVLVRSSKPISEPFISFFVELQWPQGSLIREYTLLLDPPPLAEAVQPVAGAGSAGTMGKKTAPEPFSGGRANRPAAKTAVASDGIAQGRAAYRVQSGDTLSAIAGRWVQGQPTQASVQAVTQWLFANNPQAFVGGNIDRLMAGAKLRLPESGPLTATVIAAPVESEQSDGATDRASEATVADEDNRAWMSNLPVRAEEDAIPSAAVSASSNSGGAGMVRLSQEVESADKVPSFADIESETSETVQSYLDSTRETIDVVRRENAQLQRQIEAIENSDYLNNLRELVELQRQQLEQLKSQLQAKTGLDEGVERYAANVADRAMKHVDGYSGSGAAPSGAAKADTDSLWQIDEAVDLQQESTFNRDTAKWVAALGLFLLAIILFFLIVRRLWLQQQDKYTARRLPIPEAPLVVGAGANRTEGQRPAKNEDSFDDYLPEDFKLHEDDLQQFGSFDLDDLDDLDELISGDVDGYAADDSLRVSEFEDVSPKSTPDKVSASSIDDDWDDLFDAIVNNQIAEGKEPEGFDLQLDIEDIPSDEKPRQDNKNNPEKGE